jgi:hypothetical protein
VVAAAPLTGARRAACLASCLAPPAAGLEQLGAKVADVKARLQERIAHVVRKQVRGAGVR